MAVKKPLLALLFLGMACISLCAASGDSMSEFIGYYVLTIYGQQHYVEQFVRISFISDSIVTGSIGIDLSIGPQARIPLEWEKFWNLQFSGKMVGGSSGFSFPVMIPGYGSYRFSLYFVTDEQYRPCLSGYTTLKPSKIGASARTVGVLAVKKEGSPQ